MAWARDSDGRLMLGVGGRAGRAQQALNLQKEELAQNKALEQEKTAAYERVGMANALASMPDSKLPDIKTSGQPSKPSTEGLFGSSDSAVSYGAPKPVSSPLGMQSEGMRGAFDSLEKGSLPSASGITNMLNSPAGSDLPKYGWDASTGSYGYKKDTTGVPSMAGGGEIDGAPGDDQVAAEFSDGRPARLEDGEVVLPKEFVHQIGVAQLRKAVEAVTGKKMDPTVKEPLPGQGGAGVLSAADGLAPDYSAPGDEFKRLRKTVEGAVAPLQNPVASERNTLQARPGWEKENMRFRPPMSDGSVIVEPAKPVVNKYSKPPEERAQGQVQASPNYVARAFKQTSEQDLLNKLAGEGRSLSRKGNVFRYEDPAAMQPGVSEAQRAQNMQAIKDNPGYRHPRTGELIRGNASAMRAEGRRYDHLPISGVTFSDTIEGLKLGQKTPPAADAQTMEELRGLYKGMGKAQGAELEAPTVTEAERAGNIRTRKLMEARQQMLEARAAALKPSEVWAAQRFEYDKGRNAEADKRQSRLDREKKREYFMGDKSPPPPLGLDRAIYWGLIDEFSQAGFPEDDVITYLNSINDPKLEKALMKGELVSGDDGKMLTPLEMLKARMAASLEQQQ